jgi:hypothetical protein
MYPPEPKCNIPSFNVTPSVEASYIILLMLFPLFKCNLPSVINTPLPALLPFIDSLLSVYCIEPDWEFP